MAAPHPKIFPVILAGGSGTRFWPLSRRRRPKQLLPLSGGKPLLVETLNRLRGLQGAQPATILCGPNHVASIRRLLPNFGREQILVEPVARNTAPCIGWAALHVLKRDPQGVLVVLPSDHHVTEVPRFRKLLQRAAAMASDGTLVTLGITPTGPETGFGYLRLGEPLPGGGRRVAAFVEKPDAARAGEYFRSGQYLWNAGIFVFRADALLAEMRRQLPELGVVLGKIEPFVGTHREKAVVTRLFPRAPNVSIDYGVMEKARQVATLPADIGWSDLGSFSALPSVRPTDREGNLIEGEALLVEAKGCVVLARKRPVVVIGVENLVVIDAGDAVLVVPRHRDQQVRQAVAELERRRLTRLL